MKILAVDHNALDPAQRALYQTLGKKEDVSLRLLVPSQWNDNYRDLKFVEGSETKSYELRKKRVLFSSKTHRLIYLQLSRELHECQPDILFMNSEPENFQTFEGAWLQRNCHDTKLVFTSWRNIDHVTFGYPYKFGFLNSSAERFVLNHASHGIVFNKTGKEIFGNQGFHNISVIPPALDLSVFRSDHGDPLRNRSSSPLRIGYIGRLVGEKGIDILLKASTYLSLDHRITIVGEGKERENILRFSTQLGLGEKLELLPPVDPQNIPAILNQLDVLVLPSRTTPMWKEQFGRVLIEAMACGIPVIGSSSGEIPNVIGDAGLIFKEGDAEALAIGIERLSAPELRSQLIPRGLERVKKYSIPVVAEQYYQLFHSIASLPLKCG